jgi:glyoxylase-like metal-dependent hydrolase (beta-lactamase superfamily II)
MKILKDIYVIGGGIYGIGLSSDLDCNVFFIDCGKEAVLIDSGVGINTEKLISNIEAEGLDPGKITKLLLTHSHLDHSGGASDLKRLLGLEIYISEIEAPFLESGDEDSIGLSAAKQTRIYPKNYRLKSVKIDHRLKRRRSLNTYLYRIEAIPTPGHSKGSISYLIHGHEKKIIFTGDTVFQNGTIGLLNFPDSSLKDYRRGINNFKNLGVDSLIPGHFGFVINKGQSHLDIAIKNLSEISVPKMV